MTAQLDEQKQAVEDLQARHTEDEAQFMRRSNEVDELRAEIERLGIEVRHLRSLIETKLRERRHVSGRQPVGHAVSQGNETEDDIETQLEQSHAMPDTEPGEPAGGWYAEDVETNHDVQPLQNARRVSSERKQGERLSTVSEVDEPQSNESGTTPERPPSRMRRPVHSVNSAEDDSEVRTGRESLTRATFGSSGRPRRRFINVCKVQTSVKKVSHDVFSVDRRAGPYRIRGRRSSLDALLSSQ
jgi:hypothetical protein